MSKILVTEDDPHVRAFVSRALEMSGHTVFQADDGEEGFDCLTEHNGDFDLLLSDIKMPFMDGIELAQLVAQNWPDLKILMMTGFADQRERSNGLSEIVIDVVSKPFTLDVIRNAVESALGEDRATFADQKMASA